jgi:predicted DNA-binding transcriptional regulator AlpA
MGDAGHKHQAPHLEPRGLSRALAAQYIGISPGKFDQMVLDGRMPKPRRIDSKKVWDKRELDEAFYALPHDEDPDPPKDNEWDADYGGRATQIHS